MNNKTILQLAKGFRGRSKNCIRVARERVEKALQYAYRDRRNKKRDMRALWIQRINAGTRQHGVERSISLSLSMSVSDYCVSPPIPPPNIFLLLALSLMFLRWKAAFSDSITVWWFFHIDCLILLRKNELGFRKVLQLRKNTSHRC